MKSFLIKQKDAFLEAVRASETTGPLVLAVSIGIGTGLGAVLFRWMVESMGVLFLGEVGGFLRSWTGIAYTIPVLAMGGLLVGLITHYFAPETKGHGVPEVMLAVAHDGGRIRPRVAFFKAIAAAICIGSGGSAGREGPIVQIGSSLGSAIGQFFRLPDRRIILSVACGAAAAIAATFNAPIAGVMFALEVILRRFTSYAFGLVVISTASATIVSRSFLGDVPAFDIGTEFSLVSWWEVILYGILGSACAVVAVGYTKMLYLFEDAADKVKIPDYLKPAIGGALVGLIGIWRPEIFGTGYHFIEEALHSEFALDMLIILCLTKIVATSLTIGSGGSGGIFAPSLYIGAMFGGAFGALVHGIFPESTSASGAYAIVGMAAVFAGAAHAPITAILILFEMTDDYRIIIPLMTATVISTTISQRLSSDSIYLVKLRRRGISIDGPQDVNLMDAIRVADAMTTEYESVTPNLPLTHLVLRLATGAQSGYPVVDEEGILVGMVTQSDVEHALIDRNPDLITIDDICTKDVVVCRPEQNLSSALGQSHAREFACLPVVDPDNPGKLLGVLRRADIISAYAEAHAQSASMRKRVDDMRMLSERSETVLMSQAISSKSPLAGGHVRDARFPEGSTLVAIRRNDQTLIPSGATKLELGDVLEVLATRENAREVKKWLKGQCG